MIDSRVSKDGSAIRRRRECLECANRFTTYEEIERADLRVIKRDGRHEPYDKQKLLMGMLKACEKRKISIHTIEEIADTITREIEAEFPKEVSHKVIGGKVMEHLHELDDVAYVRYASVYRQFEDIGEFIDEIQSLERRPKPSRHQPELFN